MMFLASVLILFASCMKIISGSHWCYNSQITCNHTCTGPEVWGELSEHCDGSAQSPVNVVTRKTLLDERLSPFEFTGYQEAFHGRLKNNGHTVQLDLNSNISIKGGNLGHTYKALQLHMHWGKDGAPGSEHTIDGEQFPMEMHIVHIKEQYDSLSQASKDPTGVAVLAFFFQESKSDNKKFAPLINALKHITQPNSNTTVAGVSLDMMIPPLENRTRYFRYNGSLTTPDCAEAVVWSLFENTVFLSKKQLTEFCKLQFPEEQPMINIFRPLQRMNGRQVFYSGGHVALVSTVLLFMSVLLSSTL